MNKCVLCGQMKDHTCICGFCKDCRDRFTHEGCKKLIEDRKKGVVIKNE